MWMQLVVQEQCFIFFLVANNSKRYLHLGGFQHLKVLNIIIVIETAYELKRRQQQQNQKEKQQGTLQ